MDIIKLYNNKSTCKIGAKAVGLAPPKSNKRKTDSPKRPLRFATVTAPKGIKPGAFSEDGSHCEE